MDTVNTPEELAVYKPPLYKEKNFIEHLSSVTKELQKHGLVVGVKAKEEPKIEQVIQTSLGNEKTNGTNRRVPRKSK